MSRGQLSARQVQILVGTANPVPTDAVATCWCDPVGQATYEQIVCTPVAATDATTHQIVARNPGSPRRFAGRPLAISAIAAVFALIAGGVIANSLHQALPSQPPATAPMLRYVLTGISRPAQALRLPPARPVLLRLARIAAARPPVKQPPGARVSLVVTNEWYMSTAVGGGTSSTVVIPEVDKTWYAPDGAWRQLRRTGHPLVGAVGSEQTLRAAEASSPISDQSFPAGDTSNGPDVSTLSDRPAALKAQLLAAPPYGGNGGDGPATVELFNTISLLHHQVVAPLLDAAMWRVLAGRSDVGNLGSVIDRAGRLGDAVEVTESGERLILIISPSSGQLLGWEDVFLRNPGALNIKTYPAVSSYITFLTDSWTSRLR